MSRATAWWIHLTVLGIGLTGLSLVWMVILTTPPEDKFSVVSHPFEPNTRALHVILGPMVVFGLGLVWRAHVWARVRSGYRNRRVTGLALACLAPLLVASGYSLQVVEDEAARTWITYGHACSGVSFVLLYLIHQLSRRNGQGKTGDQATSPPGSPRRSRSGP